MTTLSPDAVAEVVRYYRGEALRCDNAILRLGTAPVDPDLDDADRAEARRIRDDRIAVLEQQRDDWLRRANERELQP